MAEWQKIRGKTGDGRGCTREGWDRTRRSRRGRGMRRGGSGRWQMAKRADSAVHLQLLYAIFPPPPDVITRVYIKTRRSAAWRGGRDLQRRISALVCAASGPNGSVCDPNGAASGPNGSVCDPDGSASGPNGSVCDPDGSASGPSGSVRDPNGAAIGAKDAGSCPKRGVCYPDCFVLGTCISGPAHFTLCAGGAL
jgi:hypothetical protein